MPAAASAPALRSRPGARGRPGMPDFIGGARRIPSTACLAQRRRGGALGSNGCAGEAPPEHASRAPKRGLRECWQHKRCSAAMAVLRRADSGLGGGGFLLGPCRDCSPRRRSVNLLAARSNTSAPSLPGRCPRAAARLARLRGWRNAEARSRGLGEGPRPARRAASFAAPGA